MQLHPRPLGWIEVQYLCIQKISQFNGQSRDKRKPIVNFTEVQEMWDTDQMLRIGDEQNASNGLCQNEGGFYHLGITLDDQYLEYSPFPT